MLISPVLDEGKTSVEAYLPDSRWYDYYTGKETQSRKKYVTLNAPLDHIPLHIRGGHIIPVQEPANNTAFSRKKPVGLTVALGDDGKAQGELFWDDGESIDTLVKEKYLLIKLSCDGTGIKFSVEKNGYSAPDLPKWGFIEVFGLEVDGIESVSIDRVDIKDKASFDKDSKVLKISGLSLHLSHAHEVKWTETHSKGTGHKVVLPVYVLLTMIVGFVFSKF